MKLRRSAGGGRESLACCHSHPSVHREPRHRQQPPRLPPPPCALCMRPQRASPIQSSSGLEDASPGVRAPAGPRTLIEFPNTQFSPNYQSTWKVRAAPAGEEQALGASRPPRLIPCEWTYFDRCAPSLCLELCHCEEEHSSEEEEAGCRLVFRARCAAPNSASVCICDDNPPQSPRPMPPRRRADPNSTSPSDQRISRSLIPASDGLHLLKKVKKKKKSNKITGICKSNFFASTLNFIIFFPIYIFLASRAQKRHRI